MNYEGNLNPKFRGRIAIVVAKFNKTITHRLLKGALGKFRELGVSRGKIDVYYVPGAFEIPTVTGALVRDCRYAGIIALGAVIKGETSHDEYINRAVSESFAQQAAASGKPLMFGVLTCSTLEQAVARSGGDSTIRDKAQAAHFGNKGADCAEGVLEMIDLMNQIRPKDKDNDEEQEPNG
ncbi:MAG: 6,7-dimethyl-8-ribityllumazine synthase [Planctomycetia bacterium]|nr:6,7-dimethyl-8-ribityllumazine synthase [Planctomycetia bacterium]